MGFVLRAVVGAVGEHGLVAFIEEFFEHLAVVDAGGVVAALRMSLVFKSAFTWFFQP